MEPTQIAYLIGTGAAGFLAKVGMDKARSRVKSDDPLHKLRNDVQILYNKVGLLEEKERTLRQDIAGLVRELRAAVDQIVNLRIEVARLIDKVTGVRN